MSAEPVQGHEPANRSRAGRSRTWLRKRRDPAIEQEPKALHLLSTNSTTKRLALDGSYYVDTGEPLATEVPSVDPESEKELARIAGLDESLDGVAHDNVEEPSDGAHDNVEAEAPDQESLREIFTDKVRSQAHKLFTEEMGRNSSESEDDSN